MLVALDHMQVSVCYLKATRRFGRGIPGFHKNISSPQDINDMKNISQFFSNLAANDIVNVRYGRNYGDEPRPLYRARVLQIEEHGVRVAFDDDWKELRLV